MEPVGQGLNRYKGTPESFAKLTRGISIVSSGKIKNSDKIAEFYEATWILKTDKQVIE